MNMRRTFAVFFCFLSLLVAGGRSEEFQDDVELLKEHRGIAKNWRYGDPPGPREREIERLSKILETDPQNWTALRLRTFCYLHLEKDKEVERDLPVLLAQTPKHPWVHILSALYYDRRKGEVERPAQSLKNAIALLPENTEDERVMKASLMVDLAILHRKQGTALEKDSPDKANLTFRKGLAVMQDALKLAPDDIFTLRTTASLSLHCREFKESVQYATKALAIVKPLAQNDPL